MKFKYYCYFCVSIMKSMPTKTLDKKTAPQLWREVLEERGVKQTWLADKAGISPEHISNILADRVLLTPENRTKINEVLGTDF